MPSWSDLTKREKTLVGVLALMLVLMFFSHQPEMVGVNVAIALSWTALGVFFAMIGVLIFMPEK